MDIVVAIAAGAAGALSFARRVSEALVGVMVSVALLPPAIVFGMMIGSAAFEEAVTPILLLLVNISAILLSAIIIFWISGIEPNNWSDLQAAYTSKKICTAFCKYCYPHLSYCHLLYKFLISIVKKNLQNIALSINVSISRMRTNYFILRRLYEKKFTKLS